MMGDNVLLAFVLTLIAGLSTGIGSTIAFFSRHTGKKFLSFTLGLSAGVMIYISFMEMLADAKLQLSSTFGEINGQIYALLAFFGGIGIAAFIDRMVPEAENPHELRRVENMEHSKSIPAKDKLAKAGIFTALAIGIHNFPEGIATFMAGLSDAQLGISIAFAIAIHNIPEGIAVAVPIYFATQSRRKAFKYSFLSGLSEPLGALVAYLILMPFLSQTLLNVVFATVSGIMIYISVDELLPAAREYGEHHISILGLVVGMAIMGVSLIVL